MKFQYYLCTDHTSGQRPNTSNRTVMRSEQLAARTTRRKPHIKIHRHKRGEKKHAHKNGNSVTIELSSQGPPVEEQRKAMKGGQNNKAKGGE